MTKYYERGSLSAQDLMDEFGLNDQGAAKGNKGSSTGSKYNPLLGDGYLQDEDVDRLLKNEKLQATWKRFGNKDNEFNSVNDLDALLDRLSQKKQEAPTSPKPVHETSQDLLDARGRWDKSGNQGSIGYDPTRGRAPGVVDGVGAAADYGNRATDDYFSRFIPHLNAQANLEALEMGDAGGRHLGRYEGKVPELASGDIKDVYDYYSKKITA